MCRFLFVHLILQIQTIQSIYKHAVVLLIIVPRFHPDEQPFYVPTQQGVTNLT